MRTASARAIAAAVDDGWGLEAGGRLQIPPAGWRARSACRGAEHGLFVDELSSDHEARAKAICDGCEVRDACLAFSIAHGVQYGVWGGLNATERAKVRRVWTRQRALGVADRAQQDI